MDVERGGRTVRGLGSAPARDGYLWLLERSACRYQVRRRQTVRAPRTSSRRSTRFRDAPPTTPERKPATSSGSDSSIVVGRQDLAARRIHLERQARVRYHQRESLR